MGVEHERQDGLRHAPPSFTTPYPWPFPTIRLRSSQQRGRFGGRETHHVLFPLHKKLRPSLSPSFHPPLSSLYSRSRGAHPDAIQTRSGMRCLRGGFALPLPGRPIFLGQESRKPSVPTIEGLPVAAGNGAGGPRRLTCHGALTQERPGAWPSRRPVAEERSPSHQGTEARRGRRKVPNLFQTRPGSAVKRGLVATSPRVS